MRLPFIPSFHPGLRLSISVAPHIGHLYTLVTADIFARYNRLSNANRPVQFVTGTDEHGLKIQRAAHGASREPQEFCDSLSADFQVRLRSLPSAQLTSGRVETGEGSERFRLAIHQDYRTSSPSCRSVYLGTLHQLVTLPAAHRFERTSSRKRASYIKGSTPGGTPLRTSASIPTPRSRRSV